MFIRGLVTGYANPASPGEHTLLLGSERGYLLVVNGVASGDIMTDLNVACEAMYAQLVQRSADPRWARVCAVDFRPADDQRTPKLLVSSINPLDPWSKCSARLRLLAARHEATILDLQATTLSQRELLSDLHAELSAALRKGLSDPEFARSLLNRVAAQLGRPLAMSPADLPAQTTQLDDYHPHHPQHKP